MTLTLSYRPHTFRDVVGQRHIKPILRAMVKSGSMPPAIIFGGSRGTGKTTSARILAAALNCKEPVQGDCCGMCTSCTAVQQTNNLSVLEVDAASNGGVDEMRKIRDMCQYAHEGEWRLVLLDEAHSMSREAFNSLLKILEEPPPHTLFVLLTTETDKILETVRSRSMMFEFRRLTQEDIVGRLRHIATQEDIKASDGLLEEISSRVQGGMRDAVMLLDQVHRVGISDEDAFRELFGLDDVSETLIEAALAGDMAKGSQTIGEQYKRTGDATQMTNDLVLLVRDLLVIRSGGTPETTKTKLESRTELAKQVDTPQLTAAIRVLWELKARTRAFETDQRAAMEMGFVLVSEALRGRQAVTSSVSRQDARVAPERESLDIESIRSLLAS